MSKKRHSKQFNKQTYFSGAVIFQMEKKKNKRKIFGNTSERSKLLHK